MITFKVDYDDPDTIYNWAVQMELYCTSKFRIGLFGSVYFVGFVFSGFILMLSDKYGRLKLTQYGTILAAVCVSFLYFTTSINIAYFLIFLIGLSVF